LSTKPFAARNERSAEGSPSGARRGCKIVLLAAGASTRLGQPKQLLPYQGKTLLRHAAEMACGIPPPGGGQGVGAVFVVLGAHAEQIAPILDNLPVKIIVAEDWQEGMAASLRTGIRAAADADAVLILLCDQPLVTKELLAALLQEWEPGGIVASDYGEALGPPCVFDRAYFPELLALTGDSGARKLFKKYPCRTVVFPGGRVDIDTPEEASTLFDR
jgi:molybdenum cofactor cytidylyltransferase